MLFRESQAQKPVEVWAACDGEGGGNMASGRTFLYLTRPTMSNNWQIFGGDFITSFGLTKILGLKPGECAKIEIRRVK